MKFEVETAVGIWFGFHDDGYKNWSVRGVWSKAEIPPGTSLAVPSDGRQYNLMVVRKAQTRVYMHHYECEVLN